MIDIVLLKFKNISSVKLQGDICPFIQKVNKKMEIIWLFLNMVNILKYNSALFVD